MFTAANIASLTTVKALFSDTDAASQPVSAQQTVADVAVPTHVSSAAANMTSTTPFKALSSDTDTASPSVSAPQVANEAAPKQEVRTKANWGDMLLLD